jgi:hypothetical protein
MKTVRFTIAALALSASVFVASCSDSPTAPPAPQATAQLPQGELLDGVLRLLGLVKCTPLAADTESRTIGPWGGTINVGPHRLVVPAGALDRYVTITASIPANSNVNRVTLLPHGLEFERAAALTMSYQNCDGLGSLLPKRIAYVDNALDVLYYLLSIDNLWTNKVTGKIDHFSDYAIAW